MDEGPSRYVRPPRISRVVRAATLGAVIAAVTAAAPVGLLLVLARLLEPFTPVATAALSIAVFAIVAVAWRGSDRLSRVDRNAIRMGYFVGVAVFLLFFLEPLTGGWRDASAFYTLGLDDPYGLAYSAGGVRYAPPFFQVVAPLHWLSWSQFLFLWTAAELAALWMIAGPIAAAVLVVPVVTLEAWYANINLLVALAITLGFRWPGLWSVVLLTKITPGVGLIWFLVRREWRRLGIALGATLAIVAVSFVLSPDLWSSWIKALASSSPPDRVADVAPLPLRVAVAALVVTVGARLDQAWTVPVGATLAMPVLWPAALSVLVAAVPLARSPSPIGRRRAVDWALGAGTARAGAPGWADALAIVRGTRRSEAAASPTDADILP